MSLEAFLRVSCKGSKRIFHLSQNINSQRAGEVGVAALCVDLRDQGAQRNVLRCGDFVEFIPKRFFQADAGGMACDSDGVFFHGSGFNLAALPCPRA